MPRSPAASPSSPPTRDIAGRSSTRPSWRSSRRASTSPTRRSGAWPQLAKQILAQHYGRPAARAYFMGCSTGGREGMLMAQRYPTYFDGIVVGAPAMRTHYLRDRRRVGRDDAEPRGAARRVGQAGRPSRVLGRRSQGGDRRPARVLRRRRRPARRRRLRSDRVPLRSRVPGLRGREDRRLPLASAGRRPGQGVRAARRTRKGGRCTRASRSTRASSPPRASPDCSPAA